MPHLQRFGSLPVPDGRCLMTRDTKVKVAGDVVFAGALTLALVWGEWAVMLALLTAGGVGYMACLADLAADRPVARWARHAGQWYRARKTSPADPQRPAPAPRRSASASGSWSDFRAAYVPTNGEAPPSWPNGHGGSAR